MHLLYVLASFTRPVLDVCFRFLPNSDTLLSEELLHGTTGPGRARTALLSLFSCACFYVAPGKYTRRFYALVEVWGVYEVAGA